jgi:hypothetical protein
MDQSENDSEASSDGPEEIDRWQALKDAARQALATAECPPGATPWEKIPPFQQAMMMTLWMVNQDEDFRKETAKHIS